MRKKSKEQDQSAAENPQTSAAIRLHHLEVLERISRISLKATSVQEMLERVLAEILDIFAADRAWFLYPCNPEAPSWHVPMERTRPQWPGALSIGADYPMTPEVAAVYSAALAAEWPVRFDATSGHALPASVIEAFSVKSQLCSAVYPKISQPWLFGIHHCDQARVYSEDEVKLFNEIRLRIADSLSSLITLKNLRQSEEKYRGLFQRMAQGVMYLDAQGGIVSVNPALEKILGLGVDRLKDGLLRQLPWRLVRDDGTPFPIDEFPGLVALRTGNPVNDVILGICPPRAGDCRWLVVDAIPQREADQDRPAQVFVTFTDITERKLAREQAQAAMLEKVRVEAASSAKSIFLARMSHEIRTPLGAIIGFAEAIASQQHDAAQDQLSLEAIIRNGNHLLHLINEVLDLSKIEANRLELNLQPCSLMRILNEVELLIAPQAAEKGLAFQVVCHSPLPETIVSDPLRLKQILINLGANAVKFTPQGYIHLEVAADRQTKRLTLAVIDTGVGLSAEQQQRIFTEYRQGDASVSQNYGGTGLGLSIAQNLANLLGGHISVTSQPGQGSRFELNLPCVETGHVVELPPATAGAERDGRTRGRDEARSRHGQQFRQVAGSILLAEDNADNQRLLALYIQRAGAQVRSVENGRAAVEAFAEHDFDLILMDMQMPELNGIEAVAALRRGGCTVPIVMLSANAMVEDQKKAIAVGCNDYITKPVDRKRFHDMLERYLPPSSPGSDDNTPVSSRLWAQDAVFDELIREFVASLPPAAAKIEQAVKEADWQEVSSQYHQLKGLGGSYGYPQLTQLAEQQEAFLLCQDWSAVAASVAQLQTMCERIVKGIAE